MSLSWIQDLSLKLVAKHIHWFSQHLSHFLFYNSKNLLFCIFIWQNETDTTRNFFRNITHMLPFAIEQLFSFFVLRNKQFLFRLYVTLTVFS